MSITITVILGKGKRSGGQKVDRAETDKIRGNKVNNDEMRKKARRK